MTHTINRRKALTVVAAAPAAVALMPTQLHAVEGDDTELLRLGVELQRLWDLEKPLWDACQKAADEHDFERAEDYLKPAAKYQSKTWEVALEIADLSATTIAGLKVKALAHRYMFYQEREFEQPDQELAWGICEDIEAMAEEALS